MATFTGFRTSLKSGIDASILPSPSHLAPAARPRSSGWMIWTALAALAVTLAAGPALPQAGVQLVKVDLSVVAKGYRMSKLIGSSVINDKNEKIGTVDDLIADKDKKLKIVARPNQNSPLMEGMTPLMGIDVWEHAYYLKYRNKRADYVKAWWNVVNWDNVADRYKAASK